MASLGHNELVISTLEVAENLSKFLQSPIGVEIFILWNITKMFEARVLVDKKIKNHDFRGFQNRQ